MTWFDTLERAAKIDLSIQHPDFASTREAVAAANPTAHQGAINMAAGAICEIGLENAARDCFAIMEAQACVFRYRDTLLGAVK